MSQHKQTYCCSNPECHKMFTLEEAKYSSEIMQQAEIGVAKTLPHGTPIVHVLCPKCETIVASIHMPAETI